MYSCSLVTSAVPSLLCKCDSLSARLGTGLGNSIRKKQRSKKKKRLLCCQPQKKNNHPACQATEDAKSGRWWRKAEGYHSLVTFLRISMSPHISQPQMFWTTCQNKYYVRGTSDKHAVSITVLALYTLCNTHIKVEITDMVFGEGRVWSVFFITSSLATHFQKTFAVLKSQAAPCTVYVYGLCTFSMDVTMLLGFLPNPGCSMPPWPMQKSRTMLECEWELTVQSSLLLCVRV